MTEGFIVDGSFGLVEQQITGKRLRDIGAVGVIGYVSPNTMKNLTARMLDDYLTSGLSVGLVWEDAETSMMTASGTSHGEQAYRQAHAIGYDIDHCVMFAAADWNVQASQLVTVNGYMAGFSDYVGHPGIYSNQRTLDMLAVTNNADYFWQSNSKSYSNGTSAHAHLQQLYNDPRAQHLPVDINNIVRTPLGMMGEGNVSDGFTDADRLVLNNIRDQLVSPSGFIARLGVNLAKTAQQIEAAGHTDTAAQLNTLLTALSANAGNVLQPATLDEEHAFADLVVSDFARRLGLPQS